ncbi:MAG: flagellar hook-basal body complex protein FliE [Pseudomonadota bacterium]
MNEIDTAAVLARIRDYSGDLTVRDTKAPGGFATLLARSVSTVNERQQTAAAQASAYEAGDPDADLTQVMISLQKASLSFQAMTEVRNKLVNAYQEIMNMPV